MFLRFFVLQMMLITVGYHMPLTVLCRCRSKGLSPPALPKRTTKCLMLSRKEKNGFVLIMIKPQLTANLKKKYKSLDRAASAVAGLFVEEIEVFSM